MNEKLDELMNLIANPPTPCAELASARQHRKKKQPAIEELQVEGATHDVPRTKREFVRAQRGPGLPRGRFSGPWLFNCSANRANLIYNRIFARSRTPKCAKLGPGASAVHVRSR